MTKIEELKAAWDAADAARDAASDAADAAYEAAWDAYKAYKAELKKQGETQ
tara:strand:+ start:951 stop:1103 length:153 start_codon:yes stop_codon:yes gene_type:complete